MVTDKQWVTIGRFGRPYGIKGYIKTQSFTEPLDNIFLYKEWFVYHNKQYQALTILGLKYHAKSIIAHIEQYPTRELVTTLTGKDIVIDKIHLPKLDEGEYYWRDLIGLEAINTDKVSLGKVIEIIETGANDVLVVKGNKEHLIPYLPDRTIKKVDLNEKTILVDWSSDF